MKGIGTRKVARLFRDHKPFPFTFRLTDVDGKPIAARRPQGEDRHRRHLGNLVPALPHGGPPPRRDLYTTYHDKGLEIVGLNYDEDGPPEKVKTTIKAFLAENKVPYRCAVGDEKTQAQVPDFQGYPTTLFLDRARQGPPEARRLPGAGEGGPGRDREDAARREVIDVSIAGRPAWLTGPRTPYPGGPP